MRYPRHARLFHGQLDASPFVGVLFLLAIILLLNSSLVFTPGVSLQLPQAAGWPGATNLTIELAVDARGLCYSRNQLVQEQELPAQFAEAVRRYGRAITLVILADKSVTNEKLVHLCTLARDAGISDAHLATRPAPAPQIGPAPP